jgi:hypothetical protein
MPVSLEQALYLIRSTLLTLNDANRTGNYTVLHDLASPEFQARNTAADLSNSFADLRRRHFDLFSVALAAPQLSALPVLDGNGMLRLTGFFPTRPLQINFDLLFQNSGGQWRHFRCDAAGRDAAAGRATSPAAQLGAGLGTKACAGCEEEMNSHGGDRYLLRCMSPQLADFVAKVFLGRI